MKRWGECTQRGLLLRTTVQVPNKETQQQADETAAPPPRTQKPETAAPERPNPEIPSEP